MADARARAVFALVIAAALAPAALAYIHTYSGFLAGTGDVDTFSFTTDAEIVEFDCFTKAVLEVDVTRDGRYLCTLGVDGVARKARLVDIREDERATGNVRLKDADGQAQVRVKGGGEYYVAVRSTQGSAEWGFTWSEASEKE